MKSSYDVNLQIDQLRVDGLLVISFAEDYVLWDAMYSIACAFYWTGQR